MTSRPLAVSWLLATLLATSPAPAAEPAPQRIESSGTQREYLLVAPERSPAAPRSLVFVLHGHLGTAANALGGGRVPSPLSAWLDIAERDNVLVAALQGLKGSDNRTGWHDCRSDADDNPQTDDVAFGSRVAKKLVDDGRADAKRIYVMVHVERRDHDTAARARDAARAGRGLQSAKPVEAPFPHDGEDATRARRVSYGPDVGPQVVVITIDNGGHVEPSRRFHYPALYTRIVGVQNQDFEAAEEAWSFFKTKSNP